MTAPEKFEHSIHELSFIALVYAACGWGVLEIWLLTMQAGLPWHSMATFLAGILVFLAIKRSPLYWRGISSDVAPRREHRRSVSADTWSGLFLLGAGFFLGLMIILGGVFLLGIVAIALTFVPWMRLPLCRNHFGVACMMFWVGSACAVLPGHHALHPMYVPAICWALWVSSIFAILRRIEKVLLLARDMKHVVGQSEIQSVAD